MVDFLRKHSDRLRSNPVSESDYFAWINKTTPILRGFRCKKDGMSEKAKEIFISLQAFFFIFRAKGLDTSPVLADFLLWRPVMQPVFLDPEFGEIECVYNEDELLAAIDQIQSEIERRTDARKSSETKRARTAKGNQLSGIARIINDRVEITADIQERARKAACAPV